LEGVAQPETPCTIESNDIARPAEERVPEARWRRRKAVARFGRRTAVRDAARIEDVSTKLLAKDLKKIKGAMGARQRRAGGGARGR
jgi:hypothetical protein